MKPLSQSELLPRILLLAGITMLPHALHAEEAVREQPNIIVIMTDDQGYGDLSCYDHAKEVHTPNIDRLATDGVRLTDGYTSAAICGPTRAGLLSGRYQQRFGIYHNRHVFNDGFLKQITLADALKECGYTTGMVGKWHLGRMTPERWPNQRGFDEFYGFLKSMRGYTGKNPNNPIYRNNDPVGADDGYLTDSFNREAVSFINRHSPAAGSGQAKPFFLYLPYNAPHYVLEARADHLKRFNTGDKDRDTYLAMMVSVDDGVGMIIDALKKNGVYDNTLIIFLSDNGGEERQGADNGVLRGNKGRYYEGGIRVPFIVSWPKRLPAGETCSVPIMSFDIFPTAVAAAGGSMPDDRVYDSRNMLPVLTGEAKGPLHETLFWQAPDADSSKWAVRHGDWKLVAGEELYNLKDDIGETRDLAAANPDVVKTLTDLFTQWQSAMTSDPGGSNKSREGAGSSAPDL